MPSLLFNSPGTDSLTRSQFPNRSFSSRRLVGQSLDGDLAPLRGAYVSLLAMPNE